MCAVYKTEQYTEVVDYSPRDNERQILYERWRALITDTGAVIPAFFLLSSTYIA